MNPEEARQKYIDCLCENGLDKEQAMQIVKPPPYVCWLADDPDRMVRVYAHSRERAAEEACKRLGGVKSGHAVHVTVQTETGEIFKFRVQMHMQQVYHVEAL